MIPKPKAEIVVNVIDKIGLIMVYCSSLDAHRWVQENGDKFCTLFQYDIGGKVFRMYISPMYDLREVANYILSQGRDTNA